MPDERAMTTQEIGRALWQSARNIERAAPELDALMGELSELLVNARPDGVRFKALDDDESVHNDWITLAWETYFDVVQHRTGRGRRTSLGWVTVALRLYAASEESGGGWDAAGVPKLFVGFDAVSEKPWSGEAFDLNGKGSSDHLEARPPHLWHYREGEGEEGWADSWFFCVPLAALNDADALRQHVVDPLVALIGDGSGAAPDQESAFRDTLACSAPQPEGAVV